MILFLVWCIHLQPIPTDDIRLIFANEDGFFAADKNTCWHWGHDGKLKKTITPPGSISAIYAEDGTVFLSLFVREEPTPYNATWVQVGDRGFLDRSLKVRWFQKVHGDTYANLSEYYLDIQSEPFAHQVSKITLTVGLDQVDWQVGEPMFKIRPIQRRFQNNWKRLWITQRGNVFYVMNELEPTILVYDQLTLQVEKAQTPRKPSDIPLWELTLPGFVEAPSKPLSLADYGDDSVLTMEEFRGIAKRWFRSFSRIKGFQQKEDGYLVAYTIPCRETDADFPCEMLSVARLDSSGNVLLVKHFGQHALFAGFDQRTFVFKIGQVKDSSQIEIKPLEF